MFTLRTLSGRATSFALLLLLLACDERSPSAPPSAAVPAALRVLAGDGQQAVAGATLPDELIVTAVDAVDRPLPGVPIQFAVVAGGGVVSPNAVTSDGDGTARMRWTLGTVSADSQVVEARLDGVPSLRLRARATPGPASSATMAGGSAVGPVGAPLADSLAVAVKDRFGNPVEGMEVAWEVAAGGGTVSPARSFTGADGSAKAQWTLGPGADAAQAVRARVAGFDPLSFTASAVTRGAPLQLARRGGEGQRGPAGAVLTEPLEVVLRMPDGRPVPGATVTWNVPPEAGTVLPAVSRTDADGSASAVWRLGTAAGLVQATATVDEGTLVFTALTEPAPAAEMVLLAAGGGAGAVGAPLADSLAVRVRDRYGNPVAGAMVEWDAAVGGGSLEPALGPTDGAGVARTQWVLGPRVDAPQTALARMPGLAPVGFHATATTAGAPLQLARRSGDGQQGPAGEVLADSLCVVLQMPDGRPVQGAVVTWSIPPDGGTVTPATARTDADGVARAEWRLGTRAGLVRAAAAVDEGTLFFTARIRSAAPARIVSLSGGGEGPVAGPLADSLAVLVTDEYGNAVAGADVDWAAPTGGGELHPARGRTDAQGAARAEWTLGPFVGPPGQTASAAVAGLPPASFHATATTRGVPLRLARVGGDGQTGEVERPLADSLVVELRTQAGVPVQGATVLWLVTSGGGRVSPASARTDSGGRARAAWTMGRTAGPVTASARVDEGALGFSATARGGTPVAVHVARGSGQSTTRGTILPDSIVARVTDALGNPVTGALVHWSVVAGEGHLERRTSTTTPNGTASTRWAVGFTPGENAVAASVDGAGSARFTATAMPGTLTLHAENWAQLLYYRFLRYRYEGYQRAYVTDARGRRVISPPITWELDPPAVTVPATGWDTISVTTLTSLIPEDGPPPYSLIRFEDQRKLLNLPYTHYISREMELPDGPGPYAAKDTVPVVLRMRYLLTDHPISMDVPFRLYDDNGWSATTDTRQGARWPLGTRTGTRTLTVCLPEPWAFPEECRDTTITVNP